MKSQILTVVCKAPGCGKVGAPDMVREHFGGLIVPVCTRCRSKNVQIIGLAVPEGERLGTMRLTAGKGVRRVA